VDAMDSTQLERPVGTGQRQALFLRQPNELDRSPCSADYSSAFFFAAPFSVVVIRRQPFPPSSRSTCQAGKIVSPTVPATATAAGPPRATS
jgi:hypothetical protein